MKITNKNKWISVEEELPRENQIVCVWLDERSLPMCVMYELIGEEAFWTDLFEIYDTDDFINDTITHWCPLPQHPED